MRIVWVLISLAASIATASAADDPFAPLRLFQGEWNVMPSDRAKSAAPDSTVNQCVQIGAYFACQQTVNGKTDALIVFVAGGPKGYYKMRPVQPDGSSPSMAESLTVSGKRWTYRWDDREHGRAVHYRNVNTFNGNDGIHYEVAQSLDGINWKVTASGDERRVK